MTVAMLIGALMPEPHAPLSEEELTEHERRVQQSSSTRPITLRWVEYTRLVAEVRRLRSERLIPQADAIRAGARMLEALGRNPEQYRAEVARLRELLWTWGRSHRPWCVPSPGHDCPCGWDAVERELAGAEKEG